MATKLFCGCVNGGINGNTGTISKDGVNFGRIISMILVQKVANDGTINVVSESDFVNGVLPASFIAGKLNHTDPSKRWYPVNELEDVESTRDTPAQSTAESGQNTQITAIAVRTFTANTSLGGAVYLRNLEKFSCDQYGVYLIDNCGNLKGEVKRTDLTSWRPICIAKRNWYPNLVWAQGDENEQVNIQFQFDSKTSDSDAEIVKVESFGADATELEGLLNLVPDTPFTNITATTFTATLKLEYGGAFAGCLQTGLVITDFELFNVTTGLPIAIGSVTESSKGVYDFVFPAQTAADVIEVGQASTGDKYDKEGFELVVQSFVAV